METKSTDTEEEQGLRKRPRMDADDRKHSEESQRNDDGGDDGDESENRQDVEDGDGSGDECEHSQDGEDGSDDEDDEDNDEREFPETRIRLMDELDFQLTAAGRKAVFVRKEVLPFRGTLPMVHVHLHEPSTEFPYFTFVSEGLSVLRMPVPQSVIEDWGEEAQSACAHIELVAYAPKEDIEKQMSDGVELAHVWQADMVSQLAHLIHQHNLWIWRGHTMQLGAENFTNVLCTPIETCGDTPKVECEHKFGFVPACETCPPITLFALVPLTKEENEVRRSKGADALFGLVGNTAADPAGKPISFYTDLDRASAI